MSEFESYYEELARIVYGALGLDYDKSQNYKNAFKPKLKIVTPKKETFWEKFNRERDQRHIKSNGYWQEVKVFGVLGVNVYTWLKITDAIIRADYIVNTETIDYEIIEPHEPYNLRLT